MSNILEIPQIEVLKLDILQNDLHIGFTGDIAKRLQKLRWADEAHTLKVFPEAVDALMGASIGLSLDTQRDQALSAFLNALKAMLASPNAQKQQAARLLTFIRDKYTLSASDEYMKETTAFSSSSVKNSLSLQLGLMWNCANGLRGILPL